MMPIEAQGGVHFINAADGASRRRLGLGWETAPRAHSRTGAAADPSVRQLKSGREERHEANMLPY
jgi:hypothetical protein